MAASVPLEGVLDIHVCDANRQTGTQAGGGARCLARKADAIRDQGIPGIEENGAAFCFRGAARASIAIQDQDGEDESRDKAERGRHIASRQDTRRRCRAQGDDGRHHALRG